jgi:hypothetical protein
LSTLSSLRLIPEVDQGRSLTGPYFGTFV